MKAIKTSAVILFSMALFMGSCKKDNTIPSGLYTPTQSDVTAKATLSELQQGFSIYQNRCGNCHQLYSPDSFSSANWSGVLNSMAPRANLTTTEKLLVLKYVTRGK